METVINYTDYETAYVSSDEQRMIRQIKKLKDEYPDQVQIIRYPKENDGCIYCKVPERWVQIKAPRKVNLTDEQRKEIAEKLRLSRGQR